MRCRSPAAMQALEGPFLYLAQNGRAAAESASRSGIRLVVCDYFGDPVTRRLACDYIPLQALSLRALHKAGPYQGLLYGGDLENKPQLLQRLRSVAPCFGNTPAVLQRSRIPQAFFPLLKRLKIAHPATSTQRQNRGWVRKYSNSCGGQAVHATHVDRRRSPAPYYQRFIAGRHVSVLFAANRRRSTIIGCSRPLQEPCLPYQPFRFGGLIGPVLWPREGLQRLASYLQRITAALGLKGLNGLDLIACKQHLYVLELNPRPTASCELFDSILPGGWIRAHIRACQGQLPRLQKPQKRLLHGFRVLYAPAVRAGTQQTLPAWVNDAPFPAHRIWQRGQPICTIHGQGSQERTLVALLQQRHRWLRQHLFA